MEILTPKTKEKYKEYINRILSSRENKRDKDNYQEKHHIVPKTLGGTNNKENLIYLYAQEHYYAHKLLAKENPDNKGLQLAWWNMCQCDNNGKRKYHIGAKDYAKAREKAAKANSEIRKGMKFTEKHKNNLCGHGRAIINLTTGEKFSSAKEAHEITGINHSHIIECCKGSRSSAGRTQDNRPCIWRYQEEEEKDFGYNIFYIQRKILCLETGKVYQSAREASKDTGVGRTTIRNDCNKTSSRQNKKRMHFAYYDEINNSNK